MSDKYVLRNKVAVKVEDTLDWAREFEMGEQRRVARDTLPSGTEVSTVFIGLDHSWRGGPPLIFETLVFGGPLDEEMDRYSTWAEAEAGHAAMLDLVKNAESK